MKKFLSVKKVDGRNFYYIDFGSETHGRTSFRLWIHASLVLKDKEKPFIKFPVQAARIDQGKSSKTLILRPDSNFWVTDFYIPCGYRGSSSFMVKESGIIVHPYYIYMSPRGNLGVGQGALFQVPANLEAITVFWKKTGRLYGDPPSGSIILYKDGRVEELQECDLCEIEDLGEI